MTTRTRLALGALAALTLPLAACGGGDSEEAAPDTGETTTSVEAETDAVTLRGEFAPVPDAPAGAEEIGGVAEQVRTPEGATVTLTMFGLGPRVDYVAHLHTSPCDAPDPGGPHFKFDPNGDDMPPNEVHLTFTSDAVGSGFAVTEVDRPLPDGEALTVVVHEAGGEGDHHEPKLVCAEVG
ncbi:hypothetical protein [Mycolicibacterium thermoresistibile]|jgi:Cu-Zn family superoxide dismutase|uniref:Uncharacterized protein n=1 Tax=Mycolicibacterium thermoresistibile TaxID=1797 RepID=A0A100XE38_MYCTH|nr:hypothetical protein [Mycolicibacterium thermoresistibile]MCV7188917.1 hypothetical protein [Mycolicibacterium thermoresistibile]GAT14900.1 uncharacterized protein, precursor [Mycolicibacterium thermoresistibile]SNW20122.1 Uncharacterised protein [Mycolicibacterium thermoresistibile]